MDANQLERVSSSGTTLGKIWSFHHAEQVSVFVLFVGGTIKTVQTKDTDTQAHAKHLVVSMVFLVGHAFFTARFRQVWKYKSVGAVF